MFHGSIVALVTPMNERGQVDYDAYRRLIDFQLANGTDALVIAGTTGESATLTGQEFRDLLDLAVRHVNGRAPVIAGTGSADTAKAIRRTRLAQELGADAALVVTPYYNHPMQDGLEAHFTAIAEATDIPLVLYNVPARTAVDLQPDTAARLGRRDDIVAIKEAVPDMARIEELIVRCGGRLDILSGDDGSCMEAMLRGARGVVSVAANVAPGPMHALASAAVAGDRRVAEAANSSLRELFEVLAVESNPIPVKWCMAKMGLISGQIRLPLLPLAAAHHARAGKCLAELGLPTG